MIFFSILASTSYALAAEAEKASGGLPQMEVSTFSGQLFWLAITFGILFWYMSIYVIPRLGGIIEERKDRIADDLDQAAEFKQQAEAAQKSYDKALSDARAKAQGIAAETRKTVDDEITKLQSAMENDIADKISKAEERIDDMKQSATAKVNEAAVDITKAVIEKLIDEAPARDTLETAISRVGNS